MKNLILFLLIGTTTFGQNFKEFEKPIKAVPRGNPIIYENYEFLNFKEKDCKLIKNDTILLLGYSGADYKFETDYCSGIIRGMHIIETTQIKEQLKIIQDMKDLAILKFKDSVSDLKIRAAKMMNLKREKEIVEYRNNCQYEKNEMDAFNGKLRKYTDSYAVTEFLSLTIQLINFGGKHSVIFRSLQDLGCASSYPNNRSTVQVKLQNGDIITFYHSGDVDCGTFRLEGNLTNGEYLRLLKSPIDQIRLQGTKYYHDEEDIEYKEVFMDKLKCL